MNSTKRILLAYLLWLIVGAFSGYTAWILHTTGIYLLDKLIQSENWRPFGWTQFSLVPYSRFSIFVVGSAWLIYVIYLENRIQLHAKESRVWPYVGKVMFATGLVLAVCLILLNL